MNEQLAEKEKLLTSLTRRQLSPGAQRLLQHLSKEEIETIQKDNPFRKERNEAIYKLNSRGITGPILVEITGLAINTVKKSVSKEKRRHEKKQHESTSQLIKEIKDLKEAIKDNLLIDELRAMRNQMEMATKELREIKKIITKINT